MTVFKCKMCGGKLDVIKGQTICECKFCGTRQTVPNVDEDEVKERYNLGNFERRNCNFDTAFSIYSDLAISSRGNEPEAYWNTMLCRFGIVYQQDDKTKEAIPTLNRTQMGSVYDDPGYIKAIEYANSEARQYYEQQAEKIEELRKQYLRVINSEEPYDVFICYKETDENGNRTQDSVEAQKLYDYLDKEGYKVFFSRVTLQDMAGINYEPYIYAAINTAKVMFVFGTNHEYVNSSWVRNEWTRYLTIVRSDFSKLLVPVFKGSMSYFPQEIKMMQGYNLDTPGWYQDAKNKVDKVVGKKKNKDASDAFSGTADQLYRNALAHTKMKNDEKAWQSYQELMDKYPSDYRGWWGALSIKTKDFSNCDSFNTSSDELIKLFRNAYTMADDSQKMELEKVWSEYLKKCSEDQSRDSYFNSCIEQYNKKLKNAFASIDTNRTRIDTDKNEVMTLQQSIDQGIGRPDFEIEKKSKELRSKRNPFVLFVLTIILIAFVISTLVVAHPVLEGNRHLVNTGAATVLTIFGAVISLILGMMLRIPPIATGIAGAVLTMFMMTYKTPLIIGVCVFGLIAFMFFSTYISNLRAYKGIDKELAQLKEQEAEEIKNWEQEINRRIESINNDIQNTEETIAGINNRIEKWRQWGWIKDEYGGYRLRRDDFKQMIYQKCRMLSGLPSEVTEFQKQESRLEKECPLD